MREPEYWPMNEGPKEKAIAPFLLDRWVNEGRIGYSKPWELEEDNG